MLIEGGEENLGVFKRYIRWLYIYIYIFPKVQEYMEAFIRSFMCTLV
jgi:hypothetical protein